MITQSALKTLFYQLADAIKKQGDSSVPGDSISSQLVQSVVVLTDAATINWDTSLGNRAQVTLGGNRTVANPTNVIDGQEYVLEVIQDGTGSRTITWGANFVWPAATAPTLTVTAGKRDFLKFRASNGKLYGRSDLNYA